MIEKEIMDTLKYIYDQEDPDLIIEILQASKNARAWFDSIKEATRTPNVEDSQKNPSSEDQLSDESWLKVFIVWH